MLMLAKNKLPLTGNHIATLLLKASVLALGGLVLNMASGGIACSKWGTATIMICMMVGKGLHRKQKWASRVALLWQPSTQLCKKDVKIINASEAGKQHINLHFTNFSKKNLLPRFSAENWDCNFLTNLQSIYTTHTSLTTTAIWIKSPKIKRKGRPLVCKDITHLLSGPDWWITNKNECEI